MNAGRTLVLPSLVVAFSASAEPPGPVQETLLDMRVAGAVLAAWEEQGEPPVGDPMEMMTLADFSKSLDPALRRWLPTRDGWGRPIHLLNFSTPTLISFGADGRPDVRYTGGVDITDGTIDSPPDPSSPDRDIIFSEGKFDQRPEPPMSLAEKATADIRSIGTAMEAYAVDVGHYPGPTEGLTLVGKLAADLEGTYIKDLPVLDPWGRPYYVLSTGKAYAIISAGADGILESSYEGADDPTGRRGFAPTGDDDADIVYVDGEFVAGPVNTIPQAAY